jgi:hypothetical protein
LLGLEGAGDIGIVIVIGMMILMFAENVPLMTVVDVDIVLTVVVTNVTG